MAKASRSSKKVISRSKSTISRSKFSFLKNKLFLALALVAALWIGKEMITQRSDVFLVSQGSPFQQSLSLDGATSLIASNSASLNPNMTTGFVFEAWVKPASAEFSHQSIFNKTSNNQNSFNLTLQSEYIASDDKYYVIYNMIVGGGNCITPYNLFHQRTYSSAQKDEVTKWHHVAGVVHPGGKLDLFVDGQASTMNTNSVPSVCTTNATPIQIGFNQPVGAGYFKGEIDEVRITNGEPYTSNFTPTMTPFTLTAQTALLYHFNNDLSDASPNDRDALLTGATTYVVSTVPTPAPSIAPSPTAKPSVSPVPSGCYYEQVQCIKAPCNPILKCGPSPSPRFCTQVAGTCLTPAGQCVGYSNGCQKAELCGSSAKQCNITKPMPSATPISCTCPPGAMCKLDARCRVSPTPTPKPSITPSLTPYPSPTLTPSCVTKIASLSLRTSANCTGDTFSSANYTCASGTSTILSMNGCLSAATIFTQVQSVCGTTCQGK
jgi:hypothetical protein